MSLSAAQASWTLKMGAGTAQNWLFTFTTQAPGGTTPYSLSGLTWEYAVQPLPTTVGTPVVKITTTPSAAGLITVTNTAALAQVLLSIYPAATASLTPGTFYHSLWFDAGTSAAGTVFGGSQSLLLLDPTAQP